MPTILEPGVPLAEVKPWYTTQPFTCPACSCIFTLDESEVATTSRQRRAFTLTTEAAISGSTTLTGPCPSCQTPIMFLRPNIVAPGVEYPVFARLAPVTGGVP